VSHTDFCINWFFYDFILPAAFLNRIKGTTSGWSLNLAFDGGNIGIYKELRTAAGISGTTGLTQVSASATLLLFVYFWQAVLVPKRCKKLSNRQKILSLIIDMKMPFL
jgi:hypothetical protein